MNNYPLVTIAIPSYNHSKYIKQTILSIVKQTYKNIELIVIDDGSTDNSREIIKDLQKEYNFQFIFRANKGLSATLNEAVSKAKGKYFCACASDDKFLFDKIEKQVFFMENNQNYAMTYGKIIKFDDNGMEEKREVKNPKSGEIFKDILMHNTVIPAVTVMIKTDTIKNVGGYDENLYIEDWDMWLKIADKYEIGYIDEYLAYYRRHETNISKQRLKMNAAQKEILLKWTNNQYFNEAFLKWQLSSFSKLSTTNKLYALKFLKVALLNIGNRKTRRGLIKLLTKRKKK